MKLLKLHVPGHELQPAMAMFQTMMAVFMVIGPALGTLLYQSFGISSAIGVMGVSFVLSAVVLFQLPRDEDGQKNHTGESFWTEFAAGFRYVWSKPSLRALGAIFTCIGLASGLIQPLFVFLVVERLGLPKEYLQWLMMVNGAAMLIGGGAVMNVAKKVSPQMLIAAGLLISAIGTFGNSLSTALWAVMFFQFINGLFFPCIHVGINTLLLKTSDAAYIGRVNGVLTPLFMGTMVVSMSIAGWLKSLYSLPLLFGGAGLLFAVSILFVLPMLRRKEVLAAPSQKA